LSIGSDPLSLAVLRYSASHRRRWNGEGKKGKGGTEETERGRKGEMVMKGRREKWGIAPCCWI